MHDASSGRLVTVFFFYENFMFWSEVSNFVMWVTWREKLSPCACRTMDFRQVIGGPCAWLHVQWRPSTAQQFACHGNESSFQSGDRGADTSATRSAATGHWVSCCALLGTALAGHGEGIVNMWIMFCSQAG